MTANNQSPLFSVKEYELTITHKGKSQPSLALKLTKEETDILRMLIMTPDDQLRYTSRPLDKTTSFELVDEYGNNLYKDCLNKRTGTWFKREIRQSLKINSQIWKKYCRYCYNMGYTACSPLREFQLAFTKFQNQNPTQETLRWFVETVTKMTPQSPIRFGNLTDQTDNKQISTINDKEIIIYPKIRKAPTQRLLTFTEDKPQEQLY